jgi:hypothetical protein
MGVSCVAALGSSLIVLQVTTLSSGCLKIFKIKDTQVSGFENNFRTIDHQFPDFEILPKNWQRIGISV